VGSPLLLANNILIDNLGVVVHNKKELYEAVLDHELL
jgi:hypothetical protein